MFENDTIEPTGTHYDDSTQGTPQKKTLHFTGSPKYDQMGTNADSNTEIYGKYVMGAQHNRTQYRTADTYSNLRNEEASMSKSRRERSEDSLKITKRNKTGDGQSSDLHSQPSYVPISL